MNPCGVKAAGFYIKGILVEGPPVEAGDLWCVVPDQAHVLWAETWFQPPQGGTHAPANYGCRILRVPSMP